MSVGGNHAISNFVVMSFSPMHAGDCFARSSLGFNVSKAIPSLERVSFTLAVVEQTALHEGAISEQISTGSRIFAIAEDNEPSHLERKKEHEAKTLEDMSSFAYKLGAAAIVARAVSSTLGPDQRAASGNGKCDRL